MRPPSNTATAPLFRLILAAAPMAACGGQSAATEGPASPEPAGDDVTAERGDAPTPIEPEPVVYLALEVDDLMNVRDPQADQTRVTLVLIDRGDYTRSHVLGVFSGICEEAQVGMAEPGLPGDAIAGVDCADDARESRVRVLREGDTVVALRAFVAEDSEEFPEYEELERVAIDAGAELVVGEPPR